MLKFFTIDMLVKIISSTNIYNEKFRRKKNSDFQFINDINLYHKQNKIENTVR